MKCFVATAEVGGAYLLTEMKDYTLFKIIAETDKIMCKVNSDY